MALADDSMPLRQRSGAVSACWATYTVQVESNFPAARFARRTITGVDWLVRQATRGVEISIGQGFSIFGRTATTAETARSQFLTVAQAWSPSTDAGCRPTEQYRPDLLARCGRRDCSWTVSSAPSGLRRNSPAIGCAQRQRPSRNQVTIDRVSATEGSPQGPLAPAAVVREMPNGYDSTPPDRLDESDCSMIR